MLSIIAKHVNKILNVKPNEHCYLIGTAYMEMQNKPNILLEIDSVEVAVRFMRECSAHLADVSPKANNDVFDHQYNMIEVLFQIRKDKYKDNSPIPTDLDLVKKEDQITHHISIDDELDVEETLGIFNFDTEYLENEEKYKEIKSQILGEDTEEDDGESGTEDSEDDKDEE